MCCTMPLQRAAATSWAAARCGRRKAQRITLPSRVQLRTLLQDILRGWDSLSLERQRQLFDFAVLASGGGDWDGLEANLQLALALEL